MTDSEVFEVIRFYDPEIVKHNDAATMGEYSSDRDLSKLEMPPECKPIVFRCRLLSRKSRRTVSEQSTQERKFETAFRLGLVSIRNLPDRNGTLREWTPSRSKTWDALTDEALDETGLSDTDLWEIGSVIAARSFLALGTPLACPQLDSSLRAWVATSTYHRLAEQSQDGETPEASASS